MKSADWLRPKTLAELAAASTSADAFFGNLRDFLHEFQQAPDANMVAEEPPMLHMGSAHENSRERAVSRCTVSALVTHLRHLARRHEARALDAFRRIDVASHSS